MITGRCLSLWIGEQLGSVERACLRSVLRHGQPLTLYCYSRPEGIPDGVEVADAAAILPRDRVFRHRSGSFAPFSDWFRYEAQRLGLGTWVDTDVYCLAPIPMDRESLFGEQQPGRINNAVLRLPSDSPLLPPLLALFDGNSVPPWLRLRDSILSQIARRIRGRIDVGRLPWGSTGPEALTALAKAHGLAGNALPPRIFYPVPWEEADWIRDPSVPLESRVSEDTVAIHLWNDRIRQFKDSPAPRGSFLHRLQSEGS